VRGAVAGAVLAVVASGCGGAAATAPAAAPYVYTVPEAIDDGWPTGSLEDAGIDRVAMEAMVRRIRDANLQGVHAVLLVRGGRLVFEEYFEGWSRDQKHEVQSVSKSFRSTLVGIAIDEGLIPGVEASFLSFFPGLAAYRTPAKDRILLRHVLGMSSGLEWHENDVPFTDPRNDLSAMYRLPYEEWAPYVAARPVAAPPGEVWLYDTGASLMLTDLLTNVSGVRADLWADDHLYRPMGMQEHAGSWPPLSDGVRPRDMAKLGELFLRGGEWRGVRVVSREWVETATRRHLATDGAGWHAGYGYLWWVGSETVRGVSLDCFSAWGANGQAIAVFPGLDLVAVVTAGNPDADTPFALMRQEILPAVLAGAG
jgi:CubicO group peptidase (beta-lactamase class C family)